MQDAGSICLCNRPRGRPVVGLTERERRLECLAGMHKEGRVIVPDLMVSDMARSVRFYRDTPGMALAMTMTVSPERDVG